MEKQELKKNLGVMSAMSIVVGCVIGAGVFFKPYAIYQATGGAPGMGMLSWIIGGVASILGALTFAEGPKRQSPRPAAWSPILAKFTTIRSASLPVGCR